MQRNFSSLLSLSVMALLLVGAGCARTTSTPARTSATPVGEAAAFEKPAPPTKPTERPVVPPEAKNIPRPY